MRFLYELWFAQPHKFRPLFPYPEMSYERFCDVLGDLGHHAVAETSQGPFAYGYAYDYSMPNSCAWMSVVRSHDSDESGEGVPSLEHLASTLTHELFVSLDVRRLYLTLLEFEPDSDLTEGIFEYVATFPDHEYVDGDYWAAHVLAVTRDGWAASVAAPETRGRSRPVSQSVTTNV